MGGIQFAGHVDEVLIRCGNWLAIACSLILLGVPAFAQAAYLGRGSSSGSAGFYASGNGSCPAPNFCAYTGADLIPWGTVPNFGGAINNSATAYDTSFLGHTNFDGSTFGNAALLSPVTRITDSLSAPGRTNATFTAGLGGSGEAAASNVDTSLVGLIDNGRNYIGLFNTSGALLGHFTPIHGGVFITTELCTGTGCVVGNSGQAQDFGSFAPSWTDRTKFYSVGGNSYDMTTARGYDGTSFCPYSVDPNAGTYSLLACLVDFKYGLPAYNAFNWVAGTSYARGAYVIHPLTSGEMLNGGTWTSGLTVVPGDIVSSGGGTPCMYRAIVGGTTTGSAPAFLSSGCKTDILTDPGDGVVAWRGTNSGPQFLFQNTGSTGTSRGSTFQWIATPATLATDGAMASTSSAVLTSASNPFTAAQVGQPICVTGAGAGGTTPLCTFILSFTNSGSVVLAIAALHTASGATVTLAGHPDMASFTVGDAGGSGGPIVWTNVGPAYVPANGNQLWQALGGVSSNSCSGDPCQYQLAASLNTYGDNYPNGGYGKYNADQGTGTDLMAYDATLNMFHHLNTITGIWNDYACGSGNGFTCSSITTSTVGTLLTIAAPLSGVTAVTGITAQSCPYFIHNMKSSRNGLYSRITNQVNLFAQCQIGVNHYQVWAPTRSLFDASKSLQSTFAGMNHSAVGTNKMVAFNNSGWGGSSGVFLGVYDAANSQGNNGLGTGYAPPFSVYLNPLASQGTAQTVPPGCYVTTSSVKNPDCNLSEILDSHLSWVGDPGSDTYPACGTSFNYATLGPAFNAWQNIETCYQTAPTYPTGYAPPASYALPATSVGNVWQFTHTFATGTSLSFSTQFQISEYSQDANWLFWSSDWNCQNGSTTGSAPTVYPGSGTHVDMLVVAAVPANPTSVCGLPWAASASYVVGNMIDPIEGTTGTGAVDDVFQAIYVGGPTGSVQPGPAIPNSYFNTAAGPTASSPGSTICDSASGASQNPTLPYSTSCATGTVWQDIGPQTQRGDVFAVNLGNRH